MAQWAAAFARMVASTEQDMTLADEVALCIAERQAQQPLSDAVMEAGRFGYRPGRLMYDPFEPDPQDGRYEND